MYPPCCTDCTEDVFELLLPTVTGSLIRIIVVILYLKLRFNLINAITLCDVSLANLTIILFDVFSSGIRDVFVILIIS